MFIQELNLSANNINGYVYILSNKTMPGIYKIGCTSKKPDERAIELYTTGVPTPFVIEYSIYIKNYQYIEKLVHKNLSKYNFNKEFFNYDLIKCVLELKRIANMESSYEEKYNTKYLKVQVESRYSQYLQEIEAEKLKIRMAEASKKEEELKKKLIMKKKRRWADIKGILALASPFIGFLLFFTTGNIWLFFACPLTMALLSILSSDAE